MTTIIHISDTHFGTEVSAVVRAITQTIHDLQPDIIILTGDITQRARTSQFKEAATFMANLPAKTKLAIPGNHDIPLLNPFARFLTPYRNYNRAFGSRESLWSEEGLNILCYDATSPLRHTRGKLTRHAVLRKLRAIKNSTPDSVLIACVHQPLVTAWPQDAHETLINREEIAQLWSEHQIDIVLSGHVHVPLLITTREFFPDLPHHFILAGAGTAVSHRVRPGAPNSFNVITINKNDPTPSLRVTYHYFDAALSQFIPSPPAHFSRTAQGWYQE